MDGNVRYRHIGRLLKRAGQRLSASVARRAPSHAVAASTKAELADINEHYVERRRAAILNLVPGDPAVEGDHGSGEPCFRVAGLGSAR